MFMDRRKGSFAKLTVVNLNKFQLGNDMNGEEE